jgi:uncharacterized membrane protein
MEAFLVILGFGVIGFLFGSPIVLLVRQRGQRKRIDELEQRLGVALSDIDFLRRRLRAAPAAAAREGDETAPGEAPAEGPPPSPWIRSRPPALPADARPDAPAEPAEPEGVGEGPEPPPEPAPPSPQTARPHRGVEETLTSKWLVWLGGVTVALGAVFLFRYAVDEGWLTPLARVILGLLLGGLLLSAGDWTARRPLAAVSRAMRPDYVPPALTGAGLLAIYVSLYAAHAAFGLVGPTATFVAIGLVSWSALGLSLKRGPFVAVLGLIGGYLVPALVASTDPQAAPLFLYLSLLTAGCLLVMVWRKWWWFSGLTLAGALGWPALWLLGGGGQSDQFVLSAYALSLSLLFAVLSTGLPIKPPRTPLWRWLGTVLSDTSGLGFALSGGLLLAVGSAAGFNGAAFAIIGLYGAAALALAGWRATLEGLVVIAAAVAVASALLWPDPAAVTALTEIETFPRSGIGPFAVPQEYRLYTTALMLFAALFGGGAFLGAARSRTPVVWAGVSTLAPLLFLAIAYWRVGRLETDVSWAAVGAGLALLFTGAAVVLGRRPRGGPEEVALALYAAGATAAIGLAFACVLREAWLTVALSVQTLALAWIWSQVRVRELRAIAAVVTGIVILRLVANPMILDYRGEVFGLFGWVVYGYGLPAAATLLAGRIFARSGRDAVTTLCEIAGTGLAFLMVALQLRLWTSGAIDAPGLRLFDQSVQTLWWTVAAALLLIEAKRGRRPWTQRAGVGLLGLSAIVALAVHVVILSPLSTGEPVGRLPVLNLLGLAYLLPAALFLWLASTPRLDPGAELRRLLPGLGGILLFVFVTLETRRAFRGTDVGLTLWSWPTDAELYAYSAVWIVFAMALLALGILRGSVVLRYASLTVLMVTVAKVFLVDMSGLTGLLRVASFLGLGLTLIAIGRVYQRFVLGPGARPRRPDDGDAP